MINLTKITLRLYNGLDIIPYIMGGGQLVFGAALAAGLGAAAEQVDAQENTVLAAAESPAVEAILKEFRQCVDGAITATDPKLVPGVDDATRTLVFNTMVEGCEGIKSAQLKGAAADARAEEITRSIIEGAKAEVGIKS